MSESCEQQARDLLERLSQAMYYDDPQRLSAGDVVELAQMFAEIGRLRAALKEAAYDLDAVMKRRDGELTGSAWGDVDNVRLDVLLAAKAAGEGSDGSVG